MVNRYAQSVSVGKKTFMKKSLLLAICLTAISLSGCKAPTGKFLPLENTGKTYTITFRQDGQKDVTRSVKAGETLLNIPTPVQKDGYTTVWDKTEFTSLSKDVLVLAVATANEYTISFDLTSKWGEVQFSDDEKKVTFDDAYALESPSLYGFFFTGWEIKDEGTPFDGEGFYTIADNVTLVPTWEKDEDSYRWWGGLI